MDEAERCHKICYLAYGQLLARGTADEVIAASNLRTWTVTARSQRRVHRLARDLTGRNGVDIVAPFGTTLHVSGTKEDALERAIAPHRSDPDLHWTKDQPTLEDVFILMMNQTRDNFQ
jgi:ABC-2 type transport system ATP-binding protein